jgi:moderate conductance mechanosensitive channel
MRTIASTLAWLAVAVAAVVGLSLLLTRVGIADVHVEPRQVADWLLTHGVRIVIILIVAVASVRMSRLAIGAMEHRLGYGPHVRDLEWQRRASTLGGILVRLVSSAVWFVAILTLLRELAIDVVPLLTGAGIVGLAIGFGAQNLVRDVISGFFMILEDQVRIGDVARINGVAGTIEQVNLRTLVLRDAEGAVQVFPNGTVTSLANLSKQFAYAIVDLQVLFTENLDRVYGTIYEVGASIEKDPNWSRVVLAPLEILGVDSLADGKATVRIRFRTQPLNQGKVANELRRRLLVTLVARGIRPYAG